MTLVSASVVSASVLFALGTTDVITLWVMMELNLLGFTGVIAHSSKKHNLLACVKYFLVQALLSVLILIIFLVGGSGGLTMNGFVPLILLLAKLAAAPFQGWLLGIAQDLSWDVFFLISSIQKVIPLFFLWVAAVQHTSGWVILAGLTSVGGGMRESDAKKIFVYSSVLGMGWMLSSGGFVLSLLFLSVYSLSLGVLSHRAQLSGAKGVQSLMLHDTGWGVLAIFLVMLNFSGLPPGSLFFVKYTILSYLWGEAGILAGAVLVVSTTLFIYVYLRVALPLGGWSGVIPAQGAGEIRGLIPAVLSSISGVLLLTLCGSADFDFAQDSEIYYT